MQTGAKYEFNEFQITLHKDREDFHFDDFVIANPETSQSGNWEVWKLDREGEDTAKKFEDIEFVPSDRLLEIHTREMLTEGAVYDILSSLQIGFELGEASGRKRAQRSAKFALLSLTGEIEGDDLDEAAEQHEYRTRTQQKP